MSDFPLLSCLNECQVISTTAGELVHEGPIFTTDKINRYGWGTTAEEVDSRARSL